MQALPTVADARGELLFAEAGREIPFEPRRFFCISRVPPGEVRGDHAHRDQTQFLVCLSGSCTVTVDDGRSISTVRLEGSGQGVLLPPLVWSSQTDFSEDAILLVVSSHAYDPNDYITDYDTFRRLTARRGGFVAVEGLER